MFDRKTFLGAGAFLAALAPRVAGAQLSAPAPGSSPDHDDIPELHMDLPAFDAILARDAAHKHLFTAKFVEGGLALGTMRTVIRSYGTLGVDAKNVFPVGVFYHSAVVMALGDDTWNQLLAPAFPRFPKAFRDDVGAIKTGAGNPYAHRKTGATFDASLDALVENTGAHFFICNVALSGLASKLAQATNADPRDVYERVTKDLQPNVMVAPTGSWAIHAVQERHFTLQQTSL
jgi:hypothetical protein